MRLLALIFIFLAPQALSAEPNAVIEATGEDLAYLDVQLRPKGGKELLRFQFRGTEGLVSEAITLPEDGADYEITAFDAAGRATHSGKGSIRPLLAGDRPRQLPLPTTDQEKDKGGGLVVSVSRERMVLEAFASDAPDNFIVDLQVLDPSGNPLKLDPGDIKWGLTDPTHFEILDLKERFQAQLRAKDTFPKPFKWCDVPTKVVACLPNSSCKAIRFCPDPWVTISGGATHTCALTRSGAALCWGSNDQGELGSPTTTSCTPGSKCSDRPQRVVCPAGAPCRFTHIAAGVTLTVAIDTNGDAWWWGRGLPVHNKVTATLAGSPVGFTSGAAGYGHGCAISSGRSEVWCWGTNAFGESGLPKSNTEVPHTAPARVLAPMKFRKVVAGGEHTCGISSGGTDIVCWGRDDENQTEGQNSTPFPTATGPFFFQHFGGLTPILDVAASPNSTCVTLGNNNGVRCWGAHIWRNVVPFGSPDQLAAGFDHVCAISAQQARCVGANAWGELGIGTQMLQSAPVAVNSPPAQLDKISAGDSHTCGITPGGDAYCWGKNLSGQLGNGTNGFGLFVPTLVPGQ